MPTGAASIGNASNGAASIGAGPTGPATTHTVPARARHRPSPSRVPGPAVEAANVGSDDPLARAAHDLIQQLPLRRSNRPWWLFVARPGAGSIRDSGAGLRVVTGGAAVQRSSGSLGLLPAFASDGEFPLAAVDRCFRTGRAHLAEHLAVGEGVDGASRSGCYVPLFAPRGDGSSSPESSTPEVVAVLAVESPRRRDVKARFVTQLGAGCRDRGGALVLADAAAWHGERFGDPLVPEAFVLDGSQDAPFASSVAVESSCATSHQLLAAADRARRFGTMGIVGPAGSGRTNLARCVHFLVGGDGPIVEGRADRDVERLIERLEHGRGTLLLDDLDLGPRELIDAVARGPRTRGPLVLWTAATGAFGSAPDDVEPVTLAPLHRARSRIGTLASLMVERATRALGCEPGPELDDGARAALWRWTWIETARGRALAPSAVRDERPGPQARRSSTDGVVLADLDRLARALVRQSRRGRVGATALESVAARLSIALPSRVPSRHPPRALLEAAVRATALANGRANQRRAALYLGWDRDTVRVRLREAGLL